MVVESDGGMGDSDVARFMSGVAHDQLWFARSGNNLVVSIIGTSDRMVVANWFLGQQYQIETFRTDDGDRVLQASDVQSLVDAMSQVAAPVAGQETLTEAQHAALDAVIDAAWGSGGDGTQGLQPQGAVMSLAYLEQDAGFVNAGQGIRIGEPDPNGRSGPAWPSGGHGGGGAHHLPGGVLVSTPDDGGAAHSPLAELRQQLDRLVQAMASHSQQGQVMDWMRSAPTLQFPELEAGMARPKVLEETTLR